MLNSLVQKWNKKYLLIAVAIVCLVLFFYGSQINKDYLSYLPILGGLAFGLNTLIQLAH